MGPSSPSNLPRTLNAPSLCLSRPGSPLPPWGLEQGKSSGAQPGWKRGASPPLHLAPSRPRGSSRDPHPGRPAAGSGEGEGAPGSEPPTSSSRNLGHRAQGRGSGRSAARTRGREPGPGRPCPLHPCPVSGVRHIPGPLGAAGPSPAEPEDSSAPGEGE